MIVKAIVDALSYALAALLSLLPTVTLPTWVADLGTFLQGAFGNLAGITLWVPVGAAGKALAFIFLCFTVSFVIRVSRIGLSAVTGGGGAA